MGETKTGNHEKENVESARLCCYSSNAEQGLWVSLKDASDNGAESAKHNQVPPTSTHRAFSRQVAPHHTIREVF